MSIEKSSAARKTAAKQPSVDPDRAIPPGMTRSHYWLICIWEFLLAWFGSRSYGKLLKGLPAVVLGCLVLGGVIARPFYTVGKRTIHYRMAARKAIEDGEVPVAMMCLEKLWELDPENHEALFGLAEQLNRLPDADTTTVEYIYRLAPEHEPGFGPAHCWVAGILLQNATSEQLPRVLPRIKTHLQHADAVSKRTWNSNYLWYLYYGNMGEPQRAAECLAAAASEQPALTFQTVLAARENNQSEETVRIAAAQSDRFLTRQIRSGKAPLQLHLQHAFVLEILEQPKRFVELAKAIVERFPENAPAQSFLAASITRQLSAMDDNPTIDIPLMVEMAATMWQIDPATALATLDDLARSSSNADQTRQFFDRLFKYYDDSGAMAESLAGLAAQRNDFNNAEWLFETALNKTPESAVRMNNMAWVLQRNNPDRLADALELVNRSITMEPDEPRFRETRGQVLTQLKKWESAVEDLKFALNKLPNSAETHRALAIAFRGLNKMELAKLHEQQADRLASSPGEA